MMDENKAACRVRRTGKAVAAREGENPSVIEFEGRRIAVPSDKLSDTVRPGDTVEWDGGRWVPVRPEDGG